MTTIRSYKWSGQKLAQVLAVSWATLVIVVGVICELLGTPFTPTSGANFALTSGMAFALVAAWRILDSGVRFEPERVVVKDFFSRRVISRKDVSAFSQDFSGIVFDLVVCINYDVSGHNRRIKILAMPWEEVGRLTLVAPDIAIRE